ncbi:MAG: hypothetical protein KDC38_00515 [Planctomycetes bacterium]|nr:hypothetical protein [Planctomycetota bacterium]
MTLADSTARFEALFERVTPLIGVETPLDQVGFALKFAVRQLRPPAVGVQHITCSDETERECVETLQRCLVHDVSPRLKFGNHSALRTANLAGRYEWGSLPVAENHYAITQPSGAYKLLVVKINAHVGVTRGNGGRTYGRLDRYGRESIVCSGLHAFLAGSQVPFADELREVFQAEGCDRLALLDRVDPRHRSVALALISARLQARSAVLEAQDHRPETPTIYWIVAGVTLNKPDRDSEIVVGSYVVDRRGEATTDLYRGLGDDPSHYEFSEAHHRLEIRDDQLPTVREARDHRRIVDQEWKRRGELRLSRDTRVQKVLRNAREHSNDAGARKAIIATVIPLLADLSPVSAALLFFGQGIGGIYHAYRAHRLCRDVERSDDARQMLEDLEERLGTLPPEETKKILEVLLAAYG